MTGFDGTRPPKPLTFCVGKRILAQSVFADQASAIENLLHLVKPTRGHDIATLLPHLPRQSDDESEPVLDVSHLGLAYQPLPIEIGIFDSQPGQRLEHAD